MAAAIKTKCWFISLVHMKEWNFQSVRHVVGSQRYCDGRSCVGRHVWKSPEVCLNTSRRTGCAGDFDSRYIWGLTPALTMAALCMADYFIIRLCPWWTLCFRPIYGWKSSCLWLYLIIILIIWIIIMIIYINNKCY